MSKSKEFAHLESVLHQRNEEISQLKKAAAEKDKEHEAAILDLRRKHQQEVAELRTRLDNAEHDAIEAR